MILGAGAESQASETPVDPLGEDGALSLEMLGAPDLMGVDRIDELVASDVLGVQVDEQTSEGRRNRARRR